MQKKRKVIHVIVDLGRGGAERQLIELLKKNPSHKLLIFKTAGECKKELDSNKINYKELNLNNSLHFFANFLKISEEIKFSNTSIIHAWMYNACLIVSTIKLFFNLPHSLVWGIRCSNMKLNEYSFSLRLSVKLCRILSFISNQIVYNSYSGFDYHVSQGYPSKISRVISNGIDHNKFKFSKNRRNEIRASLGIKKNDTVIVCVARVDPMKNYESLLKAFEKIRKKNKKIILLLIGKGTKDLGDKEGLISLGIKSDVENYYSAGDIIIMPSKFGEGFSNALAEGMLCKLFPITTDVGDSLKIVEGIGVIAKNPSSNALFKSFENTLNMRRSKINKLRDLARTKILKDFNVKKMSIEYDKCYNELK